MIPRIDYHKVLQSDWTNPFPNNSPPGRSSEGWQHNDFLFMLSSHSSDNMKYIHRIFFSSHPNTNFTRQIPSSLPSYSFVNIIRISFLCFLWKIHQSERRKASEKSKVSVPENFHWPVKYHHSISQYTPLTLSICCYKDIIFIVAFVIEMEIIFSSAQAATSHKLSNLFGWLVRNFTRGGGESKIY
jgi:hypothetical protein